MLPHHEHIRWESDLFIVIFLVWVLCLIHKIFTKCVWFQEVWLICCNSQLAVSVNLYVVCFTSWLTSNYFQIPFYVKPVNFSVDMCINYWSIILFCVCITNYSQYFPSIYDLSFRCECILSLRGFHCCARIGECKNMAAFVKKNMED